MTSLSVSHTHTSESVDSFDCMPIAQHTTHNVCGFFLSILSQTSILFLHYIHLQRTFYTQKFKILAQTQAM